MNENMGSNKKKKKEEYASEWDFSEGFGGMPEEVDLTQNLGCVPERKKKPHLLKPSDMETKKKAG
jgi:hypothetical protein